MDQKLRLFQLSSKGQISTASMVSHILLWIVVIGVGVWLVYAATHSNTQNQRIAPGATVNDNHSTRWPLTLDFNFSCVNQGLQDKWGKDAKPAVSVNAVKP
jgi:hypothetical protein